MHYVFYGVHGPPIKVEEMDRKGVVVASKHPTPHEGYYTKPHEKGVTRRPYPPSLPTTTTTTTLLLFLSKDMGTPPLPNHLLPTSAWGTLHDDLPQNPTKPISKLGQSRFLIWCEMLPLLVAQENMNGTKLFGRPKRTLVIE